MTPEEGRRELQYRKSKILLRTIEQLLTPEEVELIWTELLSFYDPPTRSVVSTEQDSPLQFLFFAKRF